MIEQYWPHLVFLFSLVTGICAAVHITMTKRDVRAAIGWVGVVLLSPIFGVLLYVIAGINRMRVRRISEERAYSQPETYPELSPSRRDIKQVFGDGLAGQKVLADRVSDFSLLDGNRVDLLEDGDTAYSAMLLAIGGAKHHVALQSYIFDNDAVGKQFAQALADAHSRGVKVRVLVDAVGEAYSRPTIGHLLKRQGVPYALFKKGTLGLRLAYANLRCHRKLLLVDGQLGFTGGMNIRQEFSRIHAGEQVAKDTHFRLEGPVALQLMYGFAHDWEFATRESLCTADWFPNVEQPGTVSARCVLSGPDQSVGATHSIILGALAAARSHVMIQTPYFLPDPALIAALATTARRGVDVDIVIPGKNNLRLIDYAMTGQLDLVIRTGCKVWRSHGYFDHSKIMTVDGAWSYIGSSNLDPRSLRLNFELDVELYDHAITGQLERRLQAVIGDSQQQTLEQLESQPFVKRLRNRIVGLASPYL